MVWTVLRKNLKILDEYSIKNCTFWNVFAKNQDFRNNIILTTFFQVGLLGSHGGSQDFFRGREDFEKVFKRFLKKIAKNPLF